ncbi:NAD(P)/FAD-dependent oxidoreductase [Chloroflexota bacterium]
MPLLKEAYDVLVVGGGPGGATAALVAARAGLDVLLVDKRQEIGTPVRCAEAIGWEQIKPYIELDERWVSAWIDAFRIFAPSGHSVRVPPTSPTMVVERKFFDRELVNEAARAGASVLAMTRVTSVIKEDDTVVGAKMICLGEEAEVRCKVLIAADGAESQVGRWAGLKTTPRTSEYYSAVQYLLGGLDIADARECQYHLGQELAPGGYAWFFPKGPDKANVGCVITLTQEKQGRSAQSYLNAFVEKNYPAASVLAMNLGGIPVGGTLKQVVANGIMLIGDAAHHAEPLTGGGINLAMFSGDMAAQVAARSIQAGDWSKRSLEPYHKQWMKEHGRGISAMSKARHAVIKFEDSRVEKLLKIADDLPLDDMNAFDIILAVLRHDPALLLHARGFIIPGI